MRRWRRAKSPQNFMCFDDPTQAVPELPISRSPVPPVIIEWQDEEYDDPSAAVNDENAVPRRPKDLALLQTPEPTSWFRTFDAPAVYFKEESQEMSELVMKQSVHDKPSPTPSSLCKRQPLRSPFKGQSPAKRTTQTSQSKPMPHTRMSTSKRIKEEEFHSSPPTSAFRQAKVARVLFESPTPPQQRRPVPSKVNPFHSFISSSKRQLPDLVTPWLKSKE
jgi:hypothetical protein